MEYYKKADNSVFISNSDDDILIVTFGDDEAFVKVTGKYKDVWTYLAESEGFSVEKLVEKFPSIPQKNLESFIKVLADKEILLAQENENA